MVLTDRQKRFIEHYLMAPICERYNATRAARAAGYAWPGKQGPRLMSVLVIAETIEARFVATLAEQGREDEREQARWLG